MRRPYRRTRRLWFIPRLATTSVLDAEPTGAYVVDCGELTDEIEQARAEAERWEALVPSTAPANPRPVIMPSGAGGVRGRAQGP
ncbi:hypothetical protein ACFUN7_17420 [Streptomyces sp. NPDC057236]|uniref:hypothetical protein n=1 Tax=Streptomyces sp. NPDC057236 TaxID=3346059 RepID=UPI0036446B4E